MVQWMSRWIQINERKFHPNSSDLPKVIPAISNYELQIAASAKVTRVDRYSHRIFQWNLFGCIGKWSLPSARSITRTFSCLLFSHPHPLSDSRLCTKRSPRNRQICRLPLTCGWSYIWPSLQSPWWRKAPAQPTRRVLTASTSIATACPTTACRKRTCFQTERPSLPVRRIAPQGRGFNIYDIHWSALYLGMLTPLHKIPIQGSRTLFVDIRF